MDVLALRERTRAEHEATEALLPLMSMHLDRELYVDVLCKLYTVLRGWEQWARDHAPVRFRAAVRERQRSLLLERDLQFFAVQAFPAALPPAAFVSLAGSEARLLGALYVVEGSTLGGQYIARHVESVLALTPGEGDAYFRGYGERTGALWREVKQLLSDAPPSSLDETVEAARCMFAIFANGLQTKDTAGLSGSAGARR